MKCIRVGPYGQIHHPKSTPPIECIFWIQLIIMRDAISKHLRMEVPWDMMYADDLIVTVKEDAGIQKRFSDWQGALESKGPTININKAETMVCDNTNETLMVRENIQIPRISNEC